MCLSIISLFTPTFCYNNIVLTSVCLGKWWNTNGPNTYKLYIGIVRLIFKCCQEKGLLPLLPEFPTSHQASPISYRLPTTSHMQPVISHQWSANSHYQPVSSHQPQLIQGCSHIMSAKNWVVQTPPPPIKKIRNCQTPPPLMSKIIFCRTQINLVKPAFKEEISNFKINL